MEVLVMMLFILGLALGRDSVKREDRIDSCRK